MTQRDGYSTFVDDWLPTYTGKSGEVPDLTREKVWEEVVEKYGIEKEYNEKITKWREERELLKNKGDDRKRRKEAALEEEEYANAWMAWLARARD